MSGNRKLVIEILGDARDGAKALMDIRGNADKMAAGLDKAGTVGLTAGTVLAGGLMWAAKQSEEAEQQSRKLDNSIANSSSTFKENGQALRDLAQDLQSKTAADGDAIVGAEALMVQMGLTEDQVTSLTPLVVDLSQKMGIDLDTAAKAVGKSVDGSSTALKKMGIDVDATKLKADPFAGTMDALRGSVGGFAEVEGQSFSGQLERMKNQLGDIVENVGGGAISVFSGITSKMSGMLDAASSLNPELGHTVGAIAGVGAGGLLAVGGLATIIGKAIEMRSTFTDANGELTRTGTALKGLAIAGSIAAGIVTLDKVMQGLTTDSTDLATNLNKIAAAKDSSAALQELIARTQELDGGWNDLKQTFTQDGELGQYVKLNGVNVDVTNLDKALSDIVASGNVPALESALRGLADAKVSQGDTDWLTGGTGGPEGVKNFNDVLKKYQDNLHSSKDAAKASADQNRDLGASTDGAATNQERLNSALQDYTDGLRATFDPMFAVMDAGEKLTDSQDKVAAAQDKVNFLAAVGATGSKEYKDAVKELDRAQTDQVKAALGLDDALGKLTTSVQNGEVSVDDAKAALQRWVAEGKITQAEADLTANKFQVAGVAAMDLDSKSVDIPVDASDESWWTKAFKIGAQRFDGKNVDINGNDNPFWGKVGGIVNRGSVGTVSIDINGNPNPFWGKVGNVLAGKRAAGGPVEEGQAYLVGERGPEILVAPRDGTIIPNDQIGRSRPSAIAGSGPSVTNYVYLQVDASGNPDPGRFADQVWDALTTKLRTSGAKLPASAVGS